MYDMLALHEPTSVADAIALLTERPGSSVLAGGSDILVKLRDGKMLGREWVSIQQLDELRQITMGDDGTIRLGPLSCFTAIAEHDIVRTHINSLGEAVSSIGGPQVRNVGTLGGNICNGVPSADSASTCFAWDARIELTGPDGVRVVPIADFYISAGKVDLRPAEILTAVLIDKASYDGCQGAFIKYAMRNAMDIATVNCSVVVRLDQDQRLIEDARIAFGVAAPTPIRAPQGEAALIGQPPTQAVLAAAAKAAIDDTRARDSWRASKAFREHMLATIARRCLHTAVVRAGGAIEGVAS